MSVIENYLLAVPSVVVIRRLNSFGVPPDGGSNILIVSLTIPAVSEVVYVIGS